MQMGWAHSAGVNLVSSCYLEVEKGFSGAGVYRKDKTFRTAIGLETGINIVDPAWKVRQSIIDYETLKNKLI
jgi:hypothetical protein